jgi:predicted anti-sigma-YlaC factor YlaD
MKCHEAQELLSAYLDEELSGNKRASVAEHIRNCPRCREEVAFFAEMSAAARGMHDPEPPEWLWAGIQTGLDTDKKRIARRGPSTEREWFPKKWPVGLLAAAAIVMIATGVVWIAFRTSHAPGHDHELAADFGEYLEHFAANPDRAQEVLLAKYDGQAVDLLHAAARLGYRPAAAEGLPKNYTLDTVYLLQMPCCTCVQTICRRDDGRVFAIFEHDEEQPVWFGDRPRIETQCNGCPCSVIHTDRGLVASWKANKRQLTVVGAKDLDEIADLMAHFEDDAPGA